MVEQVQNTMSNLEQYRMTMNIIKMWETYRMTVLYVFAALLVLSIILFVINSCWKQTVLFLTIVAGLTIVAFDGFKTYIAYKKQITTTEMVSTALSAEEIVIPTTEKTTADAVVDVVNDLQK